MIDINKVLRRAGQNVAKESDAAGWSPTPRTGKTDKTANLMKI
jgi:hypothetical protein